MKSWSLRIVTSDYDDDDHDHDHGDDDDYHDDDDHDDDDHDDDDDHNDYGYGDYHYSLIIIAIVVYDQDMILAKILKMCQMGPKISP